MKRRTVRPFLIGAGVLSCCAALLVMARPAAQPASVFARLAAVPVMELPYTAAQIVSKAPSAERPAVAGEVVRAVASLAKPGMTPFVVSAICRAAPEVTTEVVGAAVAVQPSEILPIGKAALAAAPDKVEGIVAALCRQEGQAFGDVAVMAAEQVPASSDKILSGISTAVPELAKSIGQARISTESRPMAEVIQKTRDLVRAEAQNTLAARKALDLVGADNSAASALRQRGANTPSTVAELAGLAKDPQALDSAASRLTTVASLGGPSLFQNPSAFFEPPPPPQAPPTLGPPFTPFSGSSTEFKAGDGTVLPPGSPRSYSGP